MKHLSKLFVSLIAALGLMLGLSACTTAQADSGPTVPISAETIIIDVRTPEEYAAGHLEGARLVNLNAGEVHAAIPTLDPEAEYVVYCRSGNRSSQAVALMNEAGITNVTDLGSLENAASVTGIPIMK